MLPSEIQLTTTSLFYFMIHFVKAIHHMAGWNYINTYERICVQK